ncbi:MAG: hypothetical protein QG589_102 [Patescibacteria group bacterium]|nr:hypothetical protein [Patescibacteria group bacterium]
MLRKILLHLKTHGKWYILLGLSICSVILWSVVIREQRNGVLTVAFLDIGQGNATFIESPTGTQVIVDGGPNKNLMREISSVVPWYDRHIDMLIVSHPDKDHYEGFISLLDKYSVDVFMEPGISAISGEYNFLKQKIISNKIPVVLARRGEMIDIGGGAYIEILFPDRDVSGLETNNASIVSRLVYGDTSLIIQGDSPQTIENYLVALDKDILDSDVIEVGHHGSKTSSSEIYIEAVSPQYAIISVGKDNTYGHPNKETLDILNKNKVKILRTDELGRITFESNGKEFVLKK